MRARCIVKMGGLVAVCGAPSPRRLAGGARTLMTATNRTDPPSAAEAETNAAMAGRKNLVIVGATGMVGMRSSTPPSDV
jgi:hypothetical protein